MTDDRPTEHEADTPVEPLDDQHLRHLRIFLDCNVTAIKSGTVRALIARLDAAESERESLRAQLCMQDLGDRAEEKLAESRIAHAPNDPVPLAHRYDQAEADLRAARDMLRKPEPYATGGVVTGPVNQIGDRGCTLYAPKRSDDA